MPVRCCTLCQEVADDAGEIVRVGDLGAQIEQRVAHVGDHGGDLRSQILEHGNDLAAVRCDRTGPVDLISDHRQRRADVVVKVAGDTRSLLVGRERADAAEHAGVVDGDAERLGQAVDDLGLLLPERVGLIGLDGDEADERAAGAQARA